MQPSDFQLRATALDLALKSNSEDVLATAQMYYEFLKGEVTNV
jgi:hypothetical protein